MSPCKYLVLAALGLAALAIDARPAEASMTNTTTAWCKPRGAADEVIVESSTSSLIWRASGDLVLQPLNRLVQKIWSSGTAGTGDKLCWSTGGALTVHDAAGGTLWSKSGGTVPEQYSGTYRYRIIPSLSGCNLSAKYIIDKRISSFPVTMYMFHKSGTLWTRAATCPKVSQSVVGDDWCMELPPAGKERQIVQTPWSELVWRPDGTLLHRGTGIAAGREIWRTPTGGQGKELCFEPTGRLVVRDELEVALWSTPAGTSTTSSHLLSLDDCDLDIEPVGGAAVWTSQHRCPQTSLPKNTHVNAGAADVVLLENAQARLVFQPDGNLVLRSIAGDEVWHSALAAGRGKRVSFQWDGNLVIYNASNAAVWEAKIWDSSVTAMHLEGCALQLLAGSTIRFSRGFPTCPSGALTNTPAWSLSRSGALTLLRTPDSRLVWQADGNLVLYTASGAPVWASNTAGTGKALSFQPDGNLVVYRVEGTAAASEALWSSGTWFSQGASHALRLGDRCTLTITDASSTSSKWTGNDSCTVVNYTFERMEGNATLGAGLRTHLTAKDDGTARLDSHSSIDLTILGHRIELLSVSGHQTESDDGSDGNNTSHTIYGDSSINVSFEQTFFEKSKTFNVGPVPVFVSIGASGELGLGISASGGTLAIEPTAGIYATVQAGVGGECDLGGASAGVRGTVTLIEVGLPISLELYLDGGQPRYAIRGDLTLSSLDGSLELYAEAFIKICLVKVSAEWSYRLFGWSGYEWSRNLFDKSGGF